VSGGRSSASIGVAPIGNSSNSGWPVCFRSGILTTPPSGVAELLTPTTVTTKGMSIESSQTKKKKEKKRKKKETKPLQQRRQCERSTRSLKVIQASSFADDALVLSFDTNWIPAIFFSGRRVFFLDSNRTLGWDQQPIKSGLRIICGARWCSL